MVVDLYREIVEIIENIEKDYHALSQKVQLLEVKNRVEKQRYDELKSKVTEYIKELEDIKKYVSSNYKSSK